ncbi:MAG: IS66 family transposase [Bacteriovoracaceae bacterium]
MYDASKETDKDVLREQNRYLQEKILFLEKQVQQKLLEKKKDEELCEKLAEELFLIKKRIFDSKQEKKANKARNQKKRKKGKLPHNQSKYQNLDEVEIDLEQKVALHKLDDLVCSKCGSDQIFEMNDCFEESSEFEVVERRYILKRHKRQKYSCKACHSIITAPGGVKLTPGGEFSIQIATQITSDKFEDHLPLERQRKQMKRAGVNVEVKTLFGLTEHLYNRLFSLNEMIRQDVLGEKWLHIDESPIDFYNPKKAKGYIWSMSNPRGAYYQFEPSRSGKIAKEMMRGFSGGAVVTDGFKGYDFLDQEKNIKHAFCWAHVRRKFFEAMNFDKKAETIVDLIDELYEVEHEADTLDDLKDLRQKKSHQIVKKIDDWIDEMDGHYLDSSSMGKAINYYIDRKKGLHYFLHDHLVPIDNNMAERRQRCPVMGRKNYLHFKSINGADIGAFFYSVIESCKSNGLNARAYINEMAHRSANNEELESPYQYSKRLTEEINARLSKELAGLKESVE